MTKWLTVLEIEEQTHIPNATIRRYMRHHGHHLNIRKKGKAYQVAQESIEIVQKIRKLYDKGKSTEQVEEGLVSMGTPVTITVPNDDQMVTVNVGEAFQSLKNEIEDLKENHHEQMTMLLDRLDKQQQYIDQKMVERDQKLTDVLRETAAGRSNHKKGWLAKLLGK
ncbi:hypothetical protein EV207_1732 [Scopulibacillus darangshiensis]|uniref:Uncharacterized protein n=1 Tax=Scopulibacillus darangshiensis TaxID=442528 RepID=A0A4R2NAC6_9BACL|nr:hypothetical protein [Scopulibacillus darangshiensis]TCP18023.1 hypothetical protein EV207_1732 [Scopulibacillus darangshiensis]